MNWTIITSCSTFLVLSALMFAVGIGIGMSIKSEKQEAFKRLEKWLKQNKEESK